LSIHTLNNRLRRDSTLQRTYYKEETGSPRSATTDNNNPSALAAVTVLGHGACDYRSLRWRVTLWPDPEKGQKLLCRLSHTCVWPNVRVRRRRQLLRGVFTCLALSLDSCPSCVWTTVDFSLCASLGKRGAAGKRDACRPV